MQDAPVGFEWLEIFNYMAHKLFAHPPLAPAIRGFLLWQNSLKHIHQQQQQQQGISVRTKYKMKYGYSLGGYGNASCARRDRVGYIHTDPDVRCVKNNEKPQRWVVLGWW